MEPLTIAALALGGTKLLGNVLSGVGQYRALAPNEAVTDEITRLERLQEADALGLTGEERNAYVQSFMDPQRALAAQQMQQSQALTGMAQDSGEQLRRMRAVEEQTQRAQAEAGRQVEMLNQAQARAQEEKLLQLSIAEADRAAQREAALFNIIGGGVADVGALTGQAIMASELAGSDAGTYNATQLQGLGAMYGYSFPSYQQPGVPFNPAFPQGAQGQMMGVPGYLPPVYYGQPISTGAPQVPTFTGGNPAQQGTGEGDE